VKLPLDPREIVADFTDHALGRSDRPDPVVARTGGPAGNARLTAWVGLILLALFGVELVTLLDLHGLLSWHVVVGVLLIPPALVKTGSTLWRFARYYTGNPAYRAAGPPPLLLRVLGPVVVLTTLAVLGTGLLLVLQGSGRQMLFLHKASFVLWLGATGLHVLGRLIPATRLTVSHGAGRLPGRALRAGVLALMLGVAVLSGVLATGLAAHWQGPAGPDDGPRHFIKYER
jgi:hypothetical protein